MSVHRLTGIPGFAIDTVATAAGSDPEILRMENLDTDLPPPPEVESVTRSAVGRDDDNSYLPFIGSLSLRAAVADRLTQQTGYRYNPENEVVITCGGTEGMFDALLATTDPGDEVILSDPTYAGMINRVRLAGAVPRLVPFRWEGAAWRLDLEALHAAVNSRTRVVFLMNPSMPTGAVLNQQEWEAIAAICQAQSAWLIYNAAMERILFDNHPFVHPASLVDMAQRTITVGSVSKEYRMIGWRIGWVVGPAAIMSDIARVHIYNVVTPTGIAQAGACTALHTSTQDVPACVAEWQRRRDVVCEQLQGFSIYPAAGGWSMLLDVGALGYDSSTASRLLLERGKIAATPMREWGGVNSDQFVRLVFSNEPVHRLGTLRGRIARVFP